MIARHGEPAPRLCNKDPLTLKLGSYVLELFPNAKFIFMVRDGRATVHSIITRKVNLKYNLIIVEIYSFSNKMRKLYSMKQEKQKRKENEAERNAI